MTVSQLLSADEMRALERGEIDSGRVSGWALMACAGRGVADHIWGCWPDLIHPRARVLVLCGPGNNGGDGYVVAARLRALGLAPQVCALGDPGALTGDAVRARDLWGAPIAPLPERVEADLVVDALFGTGLMRPLSGDLARLFAAVPEATRRVAVDIPSGLHSDSGKVLGAALRADMTVTFHSAKLGHLCGDGPAYSGALRVVDIGLPPGPGAAAALGAPVLPDKAQQGHKYTHGHALILSGAAHQTGAARLAARGALRAGAGAVTLSAPEAALPVLATHETAVMLAGEADFAVRWAGETRLAALCVGPALGLDVAAEARLSAAQALGRPMVLDADALTLLARRPRAVPEGSVLTPHLGEFARLAPDLAERLREAPEYGRAQAAGDLAARLGAVVVLKGPDSVIAAPDGRLRIATGAAPWLATAGSGDVLAGIITGLMARGMESFAAAGAGVWLHRAAARRFGPGLTAEDLPDLVAAEMSGAVAAPKGAPTSARQS